MNFAKFLKTLFLTKNLWASPEPQFFYVILQCLKNTIKAIKKQPPEVFWKKGVLKNFTKFTGKNLCQNLFFNKVAGLRPATLLKKRHWHSCFPVNFVKFLRPSLITEHL